MKILKRSSSSCSSTSNGNTLRSRSGSGRSMVSPLEDLRSLDDAFFETYGISEADGARAGVKLAADLLSTGIQVLCTIDRVAHSCTLCLSSDGRRKAGEGFIALTGISTSFNGILIVPLTDVTAMVCEPRGPRRVVTCGVRKRKGGGNKGFSFTCLDRHGGAGASLTKAVAVALSFSAGVRLAINRVAREVSCAFDRGEVWHPSGEWNTAGRRRANSNSTSSTCSCRSGRSGPSSLSDGSRFAEILEPAGLLGLYEEAFEQSGLELQDLNVVTRDDLKELVGITKRLHQIKIMTQIRLKVEGTPLPQKSVIPVESAKYFETTTVAVEAVSSGGSCTANDRRDGSGIYRRHASFSDPFCSTSMGEAGVPGGGRGGIEGEGVTSERPDGSERGKNGSATSRQQPGAPMDPSFLARGTGVKIVRSISQGTSRAVQTQLDRHQRNKSSLVVDTGTLEAIALV